MLQKTVSTDRTAGKLWLAYLAIALVVLLPLLGNGLILSVDMGFASNIVLSDAVVASYPLHATLYFLSLMLPVAAIQKLLLLAIFMVSSLGAHRLIEQLKPGNAVKSIWRWAPYFAGIFYIFNPFVYTRFMMGQWAVLFGYALLPWLLKAFLRFLKDPGAKQALVAAAITLAISVVSLHTLGLAAVIMLAALSVHGWQHRRDKQWWGKIGKYGALAGTVFVVLSSYWLVPLLLGHGPTAATIANFSAADRQAFQTVPGELGRIGNLLALQGFWGDARNLYLMPQDLFGWWLLPVIALWLLVAAGAVWAWKHQRQLAVMFGIIGLAGLLLALGGAGAIFAGYREPQKFAGLIALAYAYFGAVGAYALGRALKDSAFKNYVWLLLAVPILCMPLLLWGGAGQLKTSDYPDGWYQARELLKRENTNNAKVLFLPWHLYMPFSFSNSVITNPAPKFFEEPMVSSQNPEIGGAHGYGSDKTVQKFELEILPGAEHNQQLAKQLIGLNIKYVIVAKESDYKTYCYLENKPGITLILENSNLKLYGVAWGDK